MSPNSRTGIYLMTTSTAIVLMITGFCLARSVDSMSTSRSTEPPGDPESMTNANYRMGQELLLDDLLINECCSNGKILNEMLECEDVEKKDKLDVIANSIAVDDFLNPVKKCCLEGEYFDTIVNSCAPLKENISGFHPKLHHMKNESSKHTPYYLTEGNPECGNLSEKLQLNVTRAYPQESGWLMVDDVAMDRYLFYERGNHIAIISPPRDHPIYPAGPYYNRKGYYSINVQLIVNAEGKILNVNARYPGSVHDSAVWQMSTINTFLGRNHLQENLYYHLIGDEGYPLTPWLLTQYAGNVTNNTPQGRYNSHLRRARNSVEKVNGILKGRFRCILKHRTLNYDPIKSGKIINTCVVLHNVARHFNVAPPDDDLRILEYMDNDDRRPLEEQEQGIFFEQGNDAKIYYYEDTVSKSNLVEIELPMDRLSRKLENMREVFGIEAPEEADSEEKANEDSPEIIIKYCLDTFSDPTVNNSTVGGFVCNERTSNYTYEEAASMEEMEEWLPATARASWKMSRFKEQMMNVTETKNVKEVKTAKEMMNIESRSDEEDSRADEDKMPEINIKSFDSKAGAATIKVLWEMVATFLIMLLFKQ
nr:unnamed protein product [Callosobruchus analis]